MSEGDVYVQVLYDFTYVAEEGKEVKIRKGEELLVVQKSNSNWWQVIRDSENHPFYAPSCYLGAIGGSLNGSPEKSEDENANIENRVAENDDKDTEIQKDNHDTDQFSQSARQCRAPDNHLNSFTLAFKNPLCVEENEVNCNELELVSKYNISISNEVDTKVGNSRVSNEYKRENLSINQDAVPIYANIPLSTNISPPNPRPDDTPHRSLPNNWLEYIDENGRKYYFHSPTNKVTWKPPRRSESLTTSLDDSIDKAIHVEDPCTEIVPKPPPKQLKPKLKKLAHSSTESLDSPASPCMFTILPPGWTQECDIKTGIVYYCHEVSKKRWYSSQDENGRTYFYDEDSSESFWELPDISLSDAQEYKQPNEQSSSEVASDISFHAAEVSTKLQGTSDKSPKLRSKKVPKLPVPRQFKVRSMVVPEPVSVSSNDDDKTLSPCSLGCTIYAGTLNKTKLVEGGRRVRKNWTSCYVVLTDVFLLFYKDSRSASSSPNVKPEFSIDLNGALIDWCPDKSSRKNVFQISTITGYQLLLQHDDPKEMKEWFSTIQEAIIKLPSSLENIGGKSEEKENSRQEIKLSRSRSTKQCQCRKGSNEDINEAIPADKKRKIRDKLRQFFVRRPTMESLREKGIILDEPVFGCLLETLCEREGQPIPKFVIKCIETIERKELTADGIYRASGNLSQVQKIRFHVNQDDYKCLDEEDDVHVLTGALKMFFREMKEPLFPFQTFNKFLNAIGLPDSQSKLKALTDLVHNMPEPNYETLKFLLKHLLRVTEFHKQNRMQVQNLAIVFGPTLMWPEEESANIALDMMHQNRIVEFLLLEFHALFN